MTYIYRCHICEHTFASFKELADHKENELSQIDEIKSCNPDWSLQQCFNYLKEAIVPGDDQTYPDTMEFAELLRPA